MNTATARHMMAVGLAGALALTATIDTRMQVQTTADGRGQMVQYCAPREEGSVDAHRFYCRNGRGWETGSPPASRATSA
jgi:hypothetical protein